MSGLPFSVSTGSNKNFDSQGSSRPNFTGVNPKFDPHRCRICGGYTGGQSLNTVTGGWFNYQQNSTTNPGASLVHGQRAWLTAASALAAQMAT